MKEEYVVEYTKVNYFNNRKVREKHYHQSLDDVFGILRYSKSCKRESGLKFDSLGYTEGTICPKTNRKETWINEDISIKPMTDEDKE